MVWSPDDQYFKYLYQTQLSCNDDDGGGGGL
jgi:hypothetical protein